MPGEFGREATELQEQVNNILEEQSEEKEEIAQIKLTQTLDEAEIAAIKEKQSSSEDKSKKEGRWFKYIGLTTGIIAASAAITSMHAERTSEEGVLNQIKASDQWAYFQSKSIKLNVQKSNMVLLQALQKPVPSEITKHIDQLSEDAKEIKKEAENHEQESEAQLHLHSYFVRAVTFLQVSIALSAIAALTKKRRIWILSLALATIGFIFLFEGYAISIHSAKTAEKTIKE